MQSLYKTAFISMTALAAELGLDATSEATLVSVGPVSACGPRGPRVARLAPLTQVVPLWHLVGEVPR